MMAFPCMLVKAAQQAGMKVPNDPDDFSAKEYPHFHVFCAIQLYRPMRAGEHWENAKIIASLSNERVLNITLGELLEQELMYSQ